MSAPAHHFHEHHELNTEHMTRVLHLQQGSFAQMSYPPLDLRLSFLDALKSTIIENQQALIFAIQQDYGIRSQDETKLAEIMTALLGIGYIQKNLSDWIKPRKRKVALHFQPAENWVLYQPKGVVAIMVPWNYPLYLSIEPLATALAAGNRVMLKLSENTPNFNECLTHLLKQIFTDDWVCAFEGDIAESQYFTQLPFEHLFFTGSTAVGKQVMQAASQNLTPVTLELGGKSPCIVTQHADVALAAERIVFGKAINAGQTCVAPDYLLVESSIKDELVQALTTQYQKNYGTDITKNQDYTSIINQQHVERLQYLYQDAIQQGAEPIALAKGSLEQRRLPVTLFLNVKDSMQMLQQEIFGPWLPVIEVCDLRQALHDITTRSKPLALYLFSKNKAEQDIIQNLSQSGGLCINDTLVHLAQDDLPFGGIGHSGMGNYHGKEGFLTFSHAKGVHKKGRFNTGSWILPPYNTKIHKYLYQWFIR